MFVGESTEAASTAIRATSRSKAWLVRSGCFCRGTLSGCLAIKDVSAKSCTMNTYKKLVGGRHQIPGSLHADDCALGWKSRQGRQRLAQGGSRGSVRVRDIPSPGQGRHRVGSISSE
jgi:hypothetical protein